VDVHICLIGGIMLYCVLAFYLLWNIFFSSSCCLCRSCDLFSLRRSSRSGCGGAPWIHNNWYQSKVIWRCLWSSLIFRSLMASSILADDRLRWTPSLPRANWRKYYLGGRKSLKRWRKKLSRSWMRKPWRLFSFIDERSVGWVFLQRKQHLRCWSGFKTTIWRSC